MKKLNNAYFPTVSPIKHGYFVPQDIMIEGENSQWRLDGWPEWYHSDLAETRRQCQEWQKWPVDGLEFIPEVYQPQDLPGIVEHAKVVRDYGIDVWLCPRLLKSFAPFPLVPPQFTGKQLTQKGQIVTALKLCLHRPDLDFFNPDAVDWLFESFHDLFLSLFPNEGYQGYLWPEEHHGHSLVGRVMEKALAPWWQRPAYSDYCLEQWRQYCRAHDVCHEDKLVECMPVGDPAMVAEGKGKTGYYPGLKAKPEAASDAPVVTWPRNEGVWSAWDRFRAEFYTKNYLIRWSRKMHEVNQGNRTWHGVEYFGSSQWLLPYEKVTDPGLAWVTSTSDQCLEQWRQYCRSHDVRHEGRLVDRLPVANPGMVAEGKGKTGYYPDLEATLETVSDAPIHKRGVWAAWDAFHRLWLQSAETFFGWGYQCGLDLELLGRAPEITHICHEFRGDIATSGLESRHELFLSLIDERARQNHGVLLHGEFDGPLEHLREEEEIARWNFIKKYQPKFLSMWSVAMLHPKFSALWPCSRFNPLLQKPWYQADRVERFWRRLRAYQETSDPFAGE